MKLLVIPVLYHEYLHYTGIKNESEVWLRENLFLRNLISEYSKKHENLLEYHLSVISEFEKISDFGTLFLLSFSPKSIEFYSNLNHIIQQLYGNTLAENEALKYAQEQILQNDLITELMNLKLIWHPEVRYPLLREPNSLIERHAIEKIVIEHKTEDNFMSRNDFYRILKESEISDWINSWNNYQTQVKDCINKTENYMFVYDQLKEYFINRI